MSRTGHPHYRLQRADRSRAPLTPLSVPQEWDDELARVAQRHAEQCVFQHDCRDCKRVGECPRRGASLADVPPPARSVPFRAARGRRLAGIISDSSGAGMSAMFGSAGRPLAAGMRRDGDRPAADAAIGRCMTLAGRAPFVDGRSETPRRARGAGAATG